VSRKSGQLVFSSK